MRAIPRCVLTAAVCGLGCLVFSHRAGAQATLLSGWENPNEVEPNDPNPITPFAAPDWAGEPALATWPSGRWYAKDANGSIPTGHGSDVRLFRSDTIGVVDDDPDFPGSTHALQVVQGGSSRGGGTSHYNFTAAGVYLVNEFAAGEQTFPADPRGLALLGALGTAEDPSPALNHRIDFDLTIDFDSFGDRDAETNLREGWYEDPYFGVGLYMSAGISAGSNDWIVNEWWVGNPNDFDGVQTYPISIPFPQDVDPLLPSYKAPSILNMWRNAPNLAQPALALGFVINGNWLDGDVDTPEGSKSIYVDNLKLVEFCPPCEALARIDFDGSETADPSDWLTFMQNLSRSGDDLTGDMNGDGVVDFDDYVQFTTDWQLAYTQFPYDGGASGGSLHFLDTFVPEPSSGLLTLLAAAGVAFFRRRSAAPKEMIVVLIVVAAMSSSPANAQVTLLESWEDGLAGWEQQSEAAQGSIARVMQNATHGAWSLALGQNGDFDGTIDHAFVTWGGDTPQFAALANAANIGVDHFRLKLDVQYQNLDPDFVTSVGVSLAIGSSTGFTRLGASDETGLVPWFAGEGNQTRTIDMPLSDWGTLGDVEANNNSIYQMAIGLNGLQEIGVPFTVHFDNLRLEQVSSPDWLTLEVDRDDGNVTIKNTTTSPIDLSYYEISSASGALDMDEWNSLQDQQIGPGTQPHERWLEAGGASEFVLNEARFPFFAGESTLGPGQMWPLGEIFAGEYDIHEDLVFQYRSDARPNKLVGGPEGDVDYLVTYTGTPLPPAPDTLVGDYNDDGVVDAADYTVWRDQGGSLQAFDDWKGNFGATAPDGSASALAASTAVPEPASLRLFIVALAVYGGLRMRS